MALLYCCFRTPDTRFYAYSASIRWLRPRPAFVFGKKGIADLEIKTREKTYRVSIVSFISTHSRWNIEKGRENYYIEARRYNKLFYNNYISSGTDPYHSRDYRRESRFARTRLYLDKEPDERYENILLIFPRPKAVTYTTAKLDILDSGNMFEGYLILNEKDFFNNIRNIY